MAARERTGLRGDLNGGYNVQPRAIRRDEFPTSALGSLEAPSLRMTYANHAQRGVAPRPRSPSFFFLVSLVGYSSVVGKRPARN